MTELKFCSMFEDVAENCDRTIYLDNIFTIGSSLG